MELGHINIKYQSLNEPSNLKNASNLTHELFSKLYFVEIVIIKTNVSNLIHFKDEMTYFPAKVHLQK